MTRTTSLSDVNFGQPEAEHDKLALEQSFYEAAGWTAVASDRGVPFVVGRKGSGKSAIAARMEMTLESQGHSCFLRIIPANFRHVEIRDLLACLVNKNASWQYIYRKVWEGIVLGQVVRHIGECRHSHAYPRLSRELAQECDRFARDCTFYVADIGDALSDVISNYVRDAARKTDALSQVELRKMLEPYSWSPLVQALGRDLVATSGAAPRLVIAIDGLDEHWDNSPASLYFLAELLAVAKNFTASFAGSIRFLVCLRDNIFRALVDTKSVEYDKLESLVINLEWNSRSLFEMIARRVAPVRRLEAAVGELRDLLPETIENVAVEEYLARHVLQRPRDYVNFFKMLQKECYPEPRAGVGHVQDTVGKYCANRLVDLDNEFGLTYPGITKFITELHGLPQLFKRDQLLKEAAKLLSRPSLRSEVPELLAHYGQADTLCRILLSIGVVGTYDSASHSLRFVHEFSETRVSALWESTSMMGIHPVYRHPRPGAGMSATQDPSSHLAPAILTHPPDYLPEKGAAHADLEPYAARSARHRDDLLASLAAIDRGQPHFRRFEKWVLECLLTCFTVDLANDEEQVSTHDGGKRFEIIFDVVGKEPPWPEIQSNHGTHRLLVECKNTDEPTDADVSKLVRDMQALKVRVAFLAYRGTKREPHGRFLEHLRGAFINNERKIVIIAISEVFLVQCLGKRTLAKCRANLNKLWRDHMQRWLVT